jgi:hypothetical protein
MTPDSSSTTLMTTALLIATVLTGIALFFSKNERLEEAYEPLPDRSSSPSGDCGDSLEN